MTRKRTESPAWHVFRNSGEDRSTVALPAPPPWRTFRSGEVGGDGDGQEPKYPKFIFEDHEIDLINAAIYLRRPLLVTGKPGLGKSSFIYAVARELGLGDVLVWPINTRSTLENGLYRYDAIGRLQELEANRDERRRAGTKGKEEENAEDALGRFITLGPLGTAFLPTTRPRALLIDEIDKSDIDLPNDLLNVFEDGSYEIPVLKRVRKKWRKVKVQTHDRGDVEIEGGFVRATEFPFVVMTSNGERDFPQPFLRRCIRMQIQPPDVDKLTNIVHEHLPEASRGPARKLAEEFHALTQKGDYANDQLLNAVFLTTKYSIDLGRGEESLRELLLRDLKA
jgi:MoxR-like ATPase